MRTILFRLCTFALFLCSASKVSAFHCVLLFERQTHPLTKHVVDAFKSDPSIDVVIEATPNAWVECLKKGATEMTVVAHAMVLDPESKRVNMQFFERMNTGEKQEVLEKQLSHLEKLASILQAEIRKQSPVTTGGQLMTDPKHVQLRSIKAKIKEVKAKMLDASPLYFMRPMLPRFFQRLQEESITLTKEGKFRLKKMRLATCFPAQILKRYPGLQKWVQENDLELQQAPTHKVWSAVYKQPVVYPSKKWLRSKK